MATTFTSVRKARHDARRDAIAAFNGALADVNAIAQQIFTTLEGQPGLTVDEQEANLRAAAEVIIDLPAALAKAANDPDLNAKVTAIADRLNAAADFATDRDFEAHQAAKAAAGEGALPALDGEGFVTPDEAIGDMLASTLNDDLATSEE